MFLHIAALASAAPSTLVRVSLAEPSPEVGPGASVVLLATHGVGGERRTEAVAGGACGEVQRVDSPTLTVRFEGRVTLPARDAEVRAALCPSPATPASRALPIWARAVALSPEVPVDWVAHLQVGDRVDLLVTTRARAPDAETRTLYQDVTVVSPGYVALAPEMLEKYAHALATGDLAVALRPTPDPRPEATPERLASVLPKGMRAVAVPLAADAVAAPFLRTGDYVDAELALADRVVAFEQAIFVLPTGPLGDGLLAVVTPEQAERWVHAARVGAMLVVLRHPEDVRFVADPASEDVPLDPPAEAAWTETPSSRVAHGMRGLVVALPPGAPPAVGARVDVVAVQAGGAAPEVVLQDQRVLAVQFGRALIHVTPAGALRAAAARVNGATLRAAGR